MSKVFRLFQDGADTYQDWNSSPIFPYNSTNRDKIEDPDGASARNEITSIPSPFARIDLVKTAFREVCKPVGRSGKVDLDGNSIFHKMVSDTLDVAEIFFNIDKYQDKVEIIKWDRRQMLAQLQNSLSAGHQYLADALEKYLISDAATYNFGGMSDLYLLNYLTGPDQINIIGATSPATLFFCNANDLSYVNDIFFGTDRPFDAEYQSLYKRDFDFVKYLFTLQRSIPQFSILFPEIDEYLRTTFLAITDQAKKTEINNIAANDFSAYQQIQVKGTNTSNIVDVLGFPLHHKANICDVSRSEFLMVSGRNVSSVPLVLPTESGNKYSNLRYTTSNWGNTNHASFQEFEPDLSKRKLPFDGAVSPYLTISDFLEDTLVKVPYKLNTANYFDGNLNLEGKNFSYLLPLKPLFFEYFSLEDLKGKMADGKDMFKMDFLAGDSICVTLRIPIVGNSTVKYIEYSRIYYNNNGADLSTNSGGMTEMKFTGFIMPQVKFINAENALYNVSCVQASSANTEFVFYKGSTRVNYDDKACRNDNGIHVLKSDNYLLRGKEFDFIQVSNQFGYKGIIVPVFKPQRNIEQFEFAVDLGTSNTHIEYRTSDTQPKAFEFSASDRQLCEMFLPVRNEFGYWEMLREETALIESDFLPAEVGQGDYKFPTRTILSCAKSTDWNQSITPYLLANIPLTYDKRPSMDYNKDNDNIKWGKEKELSIMETYVRCLMLMMRNKVLLNGGNLANTKITWFYPMSMAPKRVRRLRETWDEAYHMYFGEGVTENMTESESPIQYFFKRYSTATSLVSVDIGGGTTDVAFAKDRKISHVTSFRFAANNLFENPYSDLDTDNGIINYFKEEISALLENKNLDELIKIFNSSNNVRPSNMASFLFGLKDSSIAKSTGLGEKALDFNFKLQEDENFKIIFIVFYTAIIYHIAQITKRLNLDTPRHISFSGNGSKAIRVITTDTKLLAKYTKIIFEKVLGRPYDKELELLGLESGGNPKESTCKGGLIGNDVESDIKSIVFQSANQSVASDTDTYASILDTDKLGEVMSVREFFHFVFTDMNAAFNFDKNFGVSSNSLRVARTTASKDLDTFLEKGINQCLEEADVNDPLAETFFFYPIKGALQAISMEIYQSLKQ